MIHGEGGVRIRLAAVAHQRLAHFLTGLLDLLNQRAPGDGLLKFAGRQRQRADIANHGRALRDVLGGAFGLLGGQVFAVAKLGRAVDQVATNACPAFTRSLGAQFSRAAPRHLHHHARHIRGEPFGLGHA